MQIGFGLLALGSQTVACQRLQVAFQRDFWVLYDWSGLRRSCGPRINAATQRTGSQDQAMTSGTLVKCQGFAPNCYHRRWLEKQGT